MTRFQSNARKLREPAPPKAGKDRELERKMFSTKKTLRSRPRFATLPDPRPATPVTTFTRHNRQANSASLSVSLPRCPACGIELDQRLYDAFSDGQRMKLSAQLALCQEHRRREAQAEVERRGYPLVDWALLPRRLKTFDAAIARLINEGVPSRYDDEYQDFQRMEYIPRVWKQTKCNRAGYYGPQGALIM